MSLRRLELLADAQQRACAAAEAKAAATCGTHNMAQMQSMGIATRATVLRDKRRCAELVVVAAHRCEALQAHALQRAALRDGLTQWHKVRIRPLIFQRWHFLPGSQHLCP